MVVSYNLWPVGRRWTAWSEHFHCRRKMPSKVPTLSTSLLKCIQPKSRTAKLKQNQKKVEIIITTMTMLLKTKQLLLAVCKMVARRRRRLHSILAIVASSPGVWRKREWARSEGLSATYIFVVTLSSWGFSFFFVGALRRWLPCEK